ncbi:M13 family metallopeptidase [Paraferrimonas sedimenticola]|uniref:M13 family metallopeptidase n=1 Tax=Paraferrimonas sedimenticola TaxID=375674 RepID=UPI001474050E|nr:M13 family metallopeptidase [Paraferrimonas sedimenticola]
MRVGLALALLSALVACSNGEGRSHTQTARVAAPVSGVIVANMNPDIRPQDDFYGYVNGGWQDKAKLPANKLATGAFYDLRALSLQRLKLLVEETAEGEDWPAGSEAQMIADMYRSAMDIRRLNRLGLKPIAPLLEQIDAIQSVDQLMGFFADSQILGGGTPLAFYVGIDSKDSSNYIGQFWQFGLSLPDQDYYLASTEEMQKLRRGFRKHVVELFRLARLPGASDAGEQVLALETKLAEIHWDRVQNRDVDSRYHRFNQSELPQITDRFHWDSYLQRLGLPSDEPVLINQPSYVAGLGELLHSLSLDDWKTYARWHTLNSFSSLLGDEFKQTRYEFFGRQVEGLSAARPEWNQAVSLVDDSLGDALGRLYVERYFSEDAKQQVLRMVGNIKVTFAERIKNLEWMSPQTKQKALAKLAAMQVKMGYPDQWLDYSGLDIDSRYLVRNWMNSQTYEHQRQLRFLQEGVKPWHWSMAPQRVNAYYSPTRNEIVFPAGILQAPFYDASHDDALNYGAIGTIIGHEMAHAFDDQGARYDANGNLNNWWSEADYTAFRERTHALVTQFNGYQWKDGQALNGELTLGENIGDLSGLAIAYEAYRHSRAGKPAQTLDGFTPEQRFFIGFAQIWRSKINPQTMRKRLTTGTHSPAQFRTIGPLSNFTPFYQAFDVKPGDGMYIPSQQRVSIW